MGYRRDSGVAGTLILEKSMYVYCVVLFTVFVLLVTRQQQTVRVVAPTKLRKCRLLKLCGAVPRLWCVIVLLWFFFSFCSNSLFSLTSNW